MSDPFVEKLNEKNLCSWYILPLLDLNVEAFGQANFINAYQVLNNYQIAVEVLDPILCMKVTDNPFYIDYVVRKGKELFKFTIPEYWIPDYKLFLAGKYSKFSDEAKQKIIDLCGLRYAVPDEHGNKFTDAVLMALDANPVLREKWLEILSPWGTSMPEELLSIPLESSFIIL